MILVEIVVIVALCLSAPLVGWKAQLAIRRRRHDRALAHIAKLEQDMGLAVASEPPKTQKVRAARGATYMSNSAPIQMWDAPTAPEPPPPPQKRELPFVPVLDEAYFDGKRYGVHDMEAYLAAKRSGKDVSEYEIDRTPLGYPMPSVYGFGVYGATHYPMSASYMPYPMPVPWTR